MERLNDPVFDGVGLSDFKRNVNASLFSLPILFLLVFYSSLSLPSFYWLVWWGRGQADMGPITLCQPCTFTLFNNNIIEIKDIICKWIYKLYVFLYCYN